MIEGKEKLRNIILGLLNKAGEIPKVKLAKLILFAEIEHFQRTGDSMTGLYFVRLRKGPTIAFFDEVLEDGIGTYWDKKTTLIPIFEEGRQKAQYSFIPKTTITLPKEMQESIDKVFRKYGKKSGTELSALSHNLPAWKYSEPDEPIFIAELAAKDENEYFALTDLVEDIDEGEDEFLAEKLSRALSTA